MARAAKREYNSAQRDAQAERTRQRIVDAVGRVLARGISALTMPAVAEAAGVSLPTVYRYFPDKRELTTAAANHVRERAGVRMNDPLSLAEMIATTKRVFRNIPERSDGARVLAAAREGFAASDEDVAHRRALVAEGLRDDLAGLRGNERRYFIDTVMVLCSSSSAAAFGRFGFGTIDAGERIAWILETLLIGVRARKKERERTAKG